MIERGCGLRLPTEPLACRRVVRQVRRQNLDCDVATETRVVRSMHLTHPANPDPGGDFIGTEARPGGQGHRVRR
jgi:hypothetical protein